MASPHTSIEPDTQKIPIPPLPAPKTNYEALNKSGPIVDDVVVREDLWNEIGGNTRTLIVHIPPLRPVVSVASLASQYLWHRRESPIRKEVQRLLLESQQCAEASINNNKQHLPTSIVELRLIINVGRQFSLREQLGIVLKDSGVGDEVKGTLRFFEHNLQKYRNSYRLAIQDTQGTIAYYNICEEVTAESNSIYRVYVD